MLGAVAALCGKCSVERVFPQYANLNLSARGALAYEMDALAGPLCRDALDASPRGLKGFRLAVMRVR